MGCCTKLVKCLIVIGVSVLVINYWIANKKYVFTPGGVASIAEKYAAGPGKRLDNIEAVYSKVYRELALKYKGHVLAEGDLEWIFMNAGGWMSSMCLVHASLTEYVLFFGTPLETTGHSGRYWANISDTILSGEFHQWQEGQLKTNVYKSGVTVLHGVGEVAAVNFKANTWMVEYGRGFIPSTLGFALSDTIFSTQDFITLFRIVRVYAKAMFVEICYYIANPQQIIG